MDYLSIILAFLEGIALIVSPCILPILPIILSGSLEGDRERPYGIIVGFVITFALFTFFSRALVLHTGINIEVIRYVSYGLLFLFGIIMLSTYLTEKFTLLTSRLSNTGSSWLSANDSQGGFISGLILGGLVGIIWTPCAGPILASVIVQTVLQKTTLSSFFVVIFFAIGAGMPMLLIALFGRDLMDKVKFFKTHAYLLRKIVGVIILASVVYLIYGESVSVASTPTNNASGQAFVGGLKTPYKAPEIAGITTWINSEPLLMQQLKGKVVLIDFWTYSCINCIRTLPFVKTWYEKYHDKGLVIVGVHAPEFEFEKNIDNVKNAVSKFGILYPVALDNQFVTWRNFKNQYWPAHYLIDQKGNVVYEHFGEGEYDVTENNIRYLLGLKGETSDMTSPVQESLMSTETPETYLGFSRAENYSSPEVIGKNQVSHYSFPEQLRVDHWALRGNWKISADKIVSMEKDAALKIHFNAKKVYMVMGNMTGFPIHVKLLLNGEEVIAEKGRDVSNSEIGVKEQRLYEVIDLPKSESGILQVIASAPGLEIYTFTFG